MLTSAKGMEQQPAALRLLLGCGVIGPLLFIVVFLIAGATRADYDPLRHPVSALSIGEAGWIQAASFILTGSLLLAFAAGLWRTFRHPGGSTWGPVLIGLAAVGLIGAGLFTSDPMNGYPPGTPLLLTERSTHGRLHDLFGIPVFLGLPVACFVFTRYFARHGERGWAAYSALSGIAMLITFVLAGMGFSQTPGFSDFAGGFQRLSIGIGWTWLALLAVHFLRARNADTSQSG